jgi:hypothetical protein
MIGFIIPITAITLGIVTIRVTRSPRAS